MTSLRKNDGKVNKVSNFLQVEAFPVALWHFIEQSDDKNIGRQRCFVHHLHRGTQVMYFNYPNFWREEMMQPDAMAMCNTEVRFLRQD